MANYKVVDANQLDSDMSEVANAIRAKGGTTASLSWPDGYKNAIEAIEPGVSYPPFVTDILKIGVKFTSQSSKAANVSLTVPFGSYGWILLWTEKATSGTRQEILISIPFAVRSSSSYGANNGDYMLYNNVGSTGGYGSACCTATATYGTTHATIDLVLDWVAAPSAMEVSGLLYLVKMQEGKPTTPVTEFTMGTAPSDIWHGANATYPE